MLVIIVLAIALSLPLSLSNFEITTSAQVNKYFCQCNLRKQKHLSPFLGFCIGNDFVYYQWFGHTLSYLLHKFLS